MNELVPHLACDIRHYMLNPQVYNTWVHLKRLNVSFWTICVADNKVCHRRQRLLRTTVSKDKVCRGRQILSFYFMTNFVFCDKLCRWRQH